VRRFIRILPGLVCTSLLCLFVLSCKKKDSDRVQECRLHKSIGLYAPGGYDTASYIYINDQLAGYSVNNGLECILFFDNGRLSRIEQVYLPFLPNKVVTNFHYNANGTMQSYDRHTINGLDTAQTIGHVFYYAAGLLNRVYYTEFNNQTNTLSYERDLYYTWANDNIIKLKSVNPQHLPDSSVTLYSYDNKLNYLRQLQGGAVYPFADPYYYSMSPFDYPHLLSKNNLTGFPMNPGYHVTYTESSTGLLEAMYWDGDLNVKYIYDCQ
jgi:hypothetical protein